ncbi:MAG: hypothetical protein HYY09_08030 [Firmicutes bacterium]|nr:hypothetical protein [Bacillota bacterium]
MNRKDLYRQRRFRLILACCLPLFLALSLINGCKQGSEPGPGVSNSGRSGGEMEGGKAPPPSMGPREVFGSPLLGEGQSWSRTFDRTGRYSFQCGPHPSMTGELTIAEDGTPIQVQTVIQNYMFQPYDLVIPKGSTVTWTNTDLQFHSVVLMSL